MRWLLALALVACARPEPIPTQIDTEVGRVTVRLTSDLHADDGDKVWGVWYWGDQLIEIEAHATNAVQWQAFYHERCHVTLDATGVAQTLTVEQAENVCDALATARMRERFG